MKFTDKFVLVPIERYERLMEKQSSNKIETDQTAADIETVQTGGLLDKKIENEEEIKETKDQTNKENKGVEYEEKPSLVKNFKKVRKNNPKKKFPPPPPGIPNKLKKIDFRWLTLARH